MSLYIVVYLLMGFVYYSIKAYLFRKTSRHNQFPEGYLDTRVKDHIFWITHLYSDMCMFLCDLTASRGRKFNIGDRVLFKDYDVNVGKEVDRPAKVIKNKTNNMVIVEDQEGFTHRLSEKMLKYDVQKTNEDKINAIIDS